MILTIPLIPYPYEVVVIIAESDKSVKQFLKEDKRFKKRWKEVLEKVTWQKDSCGGFYTCSPEGDGFIRLRRDPVHPHEIALLTHEALHCTAETLRRVSVHLSSESEEAYTYLLDYIVRSVLNQYKSKLHLN